MLNVFRLDCQLKINMAITKFSAEYKERIIVFSLTIHSEKGIDSIYECVLREIKSPHPCTFEKKNTS